MTSDSKKRTSKEIKQEVDDQIEKIDFDLKKIGDRLTPGHFIDSIAFGRFGNNRFAMLEHMKNSPIGTALLAGGTLILSREEHDVFEEAKKKTKEKVKDRKKISNQIDENPLTFPSLGLGLGVASGAAFPISEREKKFVGEYFTDALESISKDFDDAIYKSIEVLKDEFIDDIRSL